MTKKNSILAVAFSLLVFFSACKKDENIDPTEKYGSNYIINYGSYSGDKGGISLFNIIDSTLVNGYYESANGVETTSNVQFAYNTKGNIYFMGNNSDQIFYVNEKTFEQSNNGISGPNLVKPRYCVADGNTLYVSCWGGDVWTDAALSYITKIDLETHTILGKITLHGGPEGLAIANGKLYAALNYAKKIAVIDLNDETVSYIDAPAVSTYFAKDKDDNLYVSLISSYSIPADKEGIGFINTQTDELTVSELQGISSSYVNIMSFNSDYSKLYVMTSSYDSNWNLSGSISVFNPTSKVFESEPLISGISGLNGIATNQANEDIYYFVSESTTTSGKMVAIKSDGTEIKEYTTGIAPFMMLTVK